MGLVEGIGEFEREDIGKNGIEIALAADAARDLLLDFFAGD